MRMGKPHSRRVCRKTLCISVAVGMLAYSMPLLLSQAQSVDARYDPGSYSLVWYTPESYDADTGESTPAVIHETFQHEGTYQISLEEEHSLYINHPPSVGGVAGMLYVVSADGERALVHQTSSFVPSAFQFTQEGVYELDIYEEQLFVTQADTWWRELLGVFVPRAHAAPSGQYLATLQFEIEDADAPTAPAPTCQMRAEPSQIFHGESATLIWNSEHAGITVIDQGVGLVHIFGAYAVTPTSETTYTATFVGLGGRVTCSTTVTPVQGPIQELTLHQRAAQNARLLVNQPDAYLWGGKGWDFVLNEYTTAERILDGYMYYNAAEGMATSGVGVDCSGLIKWAYNRANDPSRHFTRNYIRYESADGQSRLHQSVPVAADALAPGDALFFDWNNNGRIDHVAMYVGDSGGYDVVNASSEDVGIEPQKIAEYSQVSGFKGFRRPIPGEIALLIRAASPVGLIVTDPDENTIDATTIIPSDEEFLREIPGELYYVQQTRGHDGSPEDYVYAPRVKEGAYRVQIVPDPDASPDATYSLTFSVHDEEQMLVANEPLHTIPEGGFLVVVANETVVEAVELSAASLLTQLRMRSEELEARPQALKNRLLAGIRTIENHVSRERMTPAIAQLNAMRRFVEIRRGSGIAEHDADILVSLLDELLLLFNA